MSLAMPYPTLTGNPPLVIAHRGACGDRPEHTLAAYSLAIAQGADFIEPDLVMTHDGLLVARHEPAIAIVRAETGEFIEGTTDVANRREFRDRLTTKMVDGQEITGWFVEDFTLGELKTLNARERLPELRGTWFDHQHLKIPTLAEIIALVRQTAQETGRKIGIYPETKHPTYFAQQGQFLDGKFINQSLGKVLIETLVTENFTNPEQIFIQSFESGNLQELKHTIMPQAGVEFPLIQLLGINEFGDRPTSDWHDSNGLTREKLSEIAAYAKGIGVDKRLIVPVENNRLLQPSHLITDAHQAGLLVHVYTLRNESVFLASDYHGNPEAEWEQFIHLGVDGLFGDFPATGVKVRNRLSAGMDLSAPASINP
ncbi:MAG: glycerophosphodiester phosphodiesterase [Chloroflexaceae bacterium]|nr:glycerophosphodiester phosphodiesterase [Chloroflexaceae bacterium]